VKVQLFPLSTPNKESPSPESVKDVSRRPPSGTVTLITQSETIDVKRILSPSNCPIGVVLPGVAIRGLVVNVMQPSPNPPPHAGLQYCPLVFQLPAHSDGAGEGISDGLTEGLADGVSEGDSEGLSDGLAEGLADGVAVVGTFVDLAFGALLALVVDDMLSTTLL